MRRRRCGWLVALYWVCGAVLLASCEDAPAAREPGPDMADLGPSDVTAERDAEADEADTGIDDPPPADAASADATAEVVEDAADDAPVDVTEDADGEDTVLDAADAADGGDDPDATDVAEDTGPAVCNTVEPGGSPVTPTGTFPPPEDAIYGTPIAGRYLLEEQILHGVPAVTEAARTETWEIALDGGVVTIESVTQVYDGNTVISTDRYTLLIVLGSPDTEPPTDVRFSCSTRDDFPLDTDLSVTFSYSYSTPDGGAPTFRLFVAVDEATLEKVLVKAE